MRCVTLFIALSIVAFATTSAQAAHAPARVSDLSSAEAVLRWINGYRAKPDPGGVPAAVRALSGFGAFKDSESAGVYVGFIAGVLAANPAKADDLIVKMFPLPPQDQWALVRAIAYSGHPEWKRLLQKFAARMPTRQVMINRYLAGKLATLEQITLDTKAGFMDTVRGYLTFGNPQEKAPKLEPSPDLLDTLWGYYFGTRAYSPIARIVSLLVLSKDRDNADRLTIGSMAKYTLASNAARDAELLDLLKWSRAQHHPKELTPILDEVIEAADTVDTAKLRREAMASIEELKRKGPGYKRDIAWWGQVGQGAIGLGCVAAAATGQVALGLPCVVGGAVGSAALNFWGQQ